MLVFLGLTPFLLNGQILQSNLSSNTMLSKSTKEEKRLMDQRFMTPEDCPDLSPFIIYVTTGETQFTKVDTFGLNGGEIRVVDCSNASAQGQTEIVGDSLFYTSPQLDALIENVCVERCSSEGSCDTVSYTFNTRREPMLHIEQVIEVSEEMLLSEVCFSTDVLEGEISCHYFLDCPTAFSGQGTQSYHWTNYSSTTNCFDYTSGLGGGTDTVCAIICDEYAICDTFKQPIRMISDTLSLPFFDDFSTGGPYPLTQNWVSRDPYINNTMAANPPSIGMATLDGLDSKGSPYPEAGDGDVFTSRYLDLFEPSSPIYLRFFYTPKGYGLCPDLLDSLRIDFKDAQDNWVTVWEKEGIDCSNNSEDSPPFLFESLVIPAAYYYDGFQFRFVNKVSPGGVYDIWHLDYISVEQSQFPPDSIFTDVALCEVPTGLMQTYQSVPLKQLKVASEVLVDIEGFESTLFNLNDEIQNPSSGSKITIREVNSGLDFDLDLTLLDAFNIEPQEYKSNTKALDSGNRSKILSGIDGLGSLDEAAIEIEYSFSLANQETSNDTARLVQRFSNYFAYDDGSAERQVQLYNPSNDEPILALEFENFLADSIKGVQFHFPHINGDVSTQLFGIYVWLDELGPVEDAVFVKQFISPLYADSVLDTLQGLTTYSLRNSLDEKVAIAVGSGQKFYIGFQQITSTNFPIPIGLDRNNRATDKMFFNQTGASEWVSVNDEDIPGAPIIRALMSGQEVIDTDVKEISEAMDVQVAPNPNSGSFRLIGDPSIFQEDYTMRLIDARGQLIMERALQSDVSLTRLSDGLFQLLIQDSKGKVIFAETISIIQ